MADQISSEINFSLRLEETGLESMLSETEELDDDEYQIPTVLQPPTLESILNEVDDLASYAESIDENHDSLSLDSSARSRSTQANTKYLQIPDGGSDSHSVDCQPILHEEAKKKRKSGILRRLPMKSISAQLKSAAERTATGNPTVLAVGTLFAVGTSRGYTLVFDERQSLRWVLDPKPDVGSVSALAFNADSSRVLIGYARGLITMCDASGKVLRHLDDVHPPNGVLALRFTDNPATAICSDAGGSVFLLSFTRNIAGFRGCNSQCLFSGSKGEVMAWEPLCGMKHRMKNHLFIALACIKSALVISVAKASLKRVFSTALPAVEAKSNDLPHLAWISPLAKVDNPHLIIGQKTEIGLFKLGINKKNEYCMQHKHTVVLSYSLLAIRCMGAPKLAILDTAERFHLIDMHRTSVEEDKLYEVECTDLSSVGLVYESSHFKGIHTGGNVSKSMAIAGEKACYNTVVSYNGQVFLLGARAMVAMDYRNWQERMDFLVCENEYAEALEFVTSLYDDNDVNTRKLYNVGASQKRLQAHIISIIRLYVENMADPEKDIPIIVNHASHINGWCHIFDIVWPTLSKDPRHKYLLLTSLEPYLLIQDEIDLKLPPACVQEFVRFYEETGKFQALEACILHMEIENMDLHLIMQISKKHSLFDAIIYVNNRAFHDYVSPIEELLFILQKSQGKGNTGESTDLTGKEIEIGNKMLVYISYCLAGRGYPTGEIPQEHVQSVKHDVFACITSVHTKDGGDTELPYPYLRTLLHFDTREFLKVVSLAFTEPEFTSELGLTQRQRLINILLQIMVDSPGFSASQVGILFTFIGRQLSRPGSGLNIPPKKFHLVFEALTSDSPDDRSDRQEILLELLRAAGLQGYLKDTLLDRATSCGFFRVCEVIYEQCGEWDKVFKCYLDDPARRPQVFSFLRNILVLSKGPPEEDALFNAVKTNIVNLLHLDENATGNLLASHFLERIPAITKDLDDSDKYYVYSITLKNRNEPVTRKNSQELFTKLFTDMIEMRVRLGGKITSQDLRDNEDILDKDAVLDVVRLYDCKEGEAEIYDIMGRHLDAFKKYNEFIGLALETNKLTFEELDQVILSTVECLQRQQSDVNTEQLWMALLDNFTSKSSLDPSDNRKVLKRMLDGSAGYVNPSVMLDFLLKNSSCFGTSFGDLRPLFTLMLQDSHYEKTLAETTLRLVHKDLHSHLNTSLRAARRGIRPCIEFCPVCGGPFQQSSAIVFPCGHTVHEACSDNCRQCCVCGIIATRRAPSRTAGRRESVNVKATESVMKLQLSVRPVLDLDRLS